MNGKRIPSLGFNNIISKIEGTLSRWRSKLLSFARKITLIKSVLLSIPIFCLAGCKVPFSVVDKIDRMIRNFLWSQDGHSYHPHMISWAQVTKPKEEGGLGLSYLRNVQQALIGKLLFRLIDLREEPWVQWIYSSYYLQDKFWIGPISSKLSPLLKEIVKVGNCFKEVKFQSEGNHYSCALSANRLYSTKSALSFLSAGSLQNFQEKRYWKWKSIWKLMLIPKIKSFLWKLLIGGLPTKGRLSSRGWLGDVLCDYYRAHPKNEFHIFFNCSFAIEVWNLINSISEEKFSPSHIHNLLPTKIKSPIYPIRGIYP